MKLEKVVIGGVEYYQFRHLGKNEVGDIFLNWKDIEYQRARLLAQVRN